jgi:transposase
LIILDEFGSILAKAVIFWRIHLMARRLPIVHESESVLLGLLETTSCGELRRRLQALYLIRVGFCKTRLAIARDLGRTRKTVGKWLSWYEAGGLTRLLASGRSRCGSKPRLPIAARAALQARLNDPAGFKSYSHISEWLKETFAIAVPTKTVWGIVHNQLKARPKVARKSNIRKDAAAEKNLRKADLPPN